MVLGVCLICCILVGEWVKNLTGFQNPSGLKPFKIKLLDKFVTRCRYCMSIPNKFRNQMDAEPPIAIGAVKFNITLG